MDASTACQLLSDVQDEYPPVRPQRSSSGSSQTGSSKNNHSNTTKNLSLDTSTSSASTSDLTLKSPSSPNKPNFINLPKASSYNMNIGFIKKPDHNTNVMLTPAGDNMPFFKKQKQTSPEGIVA